MASHNNAIDQIDRFIDSPEVDSGVLLLDALDEVRSMLFTDVLKKIEAISTAKPTLPIHVSGRWVFISRYADAFGGYRFITISPFTYDQVRQYLKAAQYNHTDIDALLGILRFRCDLLVIQIPRYLRYLTEYFTTHPIGKIKEISRNDTTAPLDGPMSNN